MQTFLPYSSILLSINCLDNKRLGKQRVEAFQILKIIEGRATSNAWKNHPAVKMWSGYPEALKLYYNYCIDEWVGRGFKNTMQKYDVDFSNFRMPSWWGDEKFHASHRSNLLRKYPEWYSQFNWLEGNDLPYVWPTCPPTFLNRV